MSLETKTEAEGNFNWRVPTIFIKSFIEGAGAKSIYEQVKSFGNVWYDEKTKTMLGSNFPVAARVDSILRPLGIRVANLADLSRPEIMEIVKDKHYSDTPSLVLRSERDSYAPNKEVIKELIPHIENKQGKLKLPVLISGLDVALSEDKAGYGWKVIPRDDFSVVYDERLDGKWNGKKFTETDVLGLPLFDTKGSRTWYARDSGISGLGSYGGGYLACSGGSGRVALVRGEASSQNFLGRYISEIQAEFGRQESELLERRERALRILQGKE